MPRVRKKVAAHQRSPKADVSPAAASVNDRSVAVSLMHALIPLGLKAVEEALQSVFLLDQNVPISVPRVRDVWAGTEVPLATYAQWQTPRAHEVGVFRQLLGGISSREYEGAAEAVPEVFGRTKSRVSRRVIRASATALQALQERRQDDAEWLVLLRDQVAIALGVTTTGETRILGLVQTATENRRVCATILRELVERGFTAPAGLLVVPDGAKGLRAAVRDVFGDDVFGDDVFGAAL